MNNHARWSGVSICLAALGLLLVLIFQAPMLGGAAEEKTPSLEEGFRNPPLEARPSTYYLLLNGYANLEHVTREMEAFREAGIGGLCVFDMGARGDSENVPPPGPPFLSPESVRIIAHIVGEAGRLGMEVDLSVSSSWDMGGSWVDTRDGSKALFHTEIEIEGPREFAGKLPFPVTSAATPKGENGLPAVRVEVAVLAVPDPRRLPGHEIIFQLPADSGRIHRAVLFNTESDDLERYGPRHLFAKEFSVAVSTTTSRASEFVEVLRGSLQPREGAQEFRFSATEARYLRLRVLSGHNPDFDRVQLGELEVYSTDGRNVLESHQARRSIDGAEVIRFSSELGQGRAAWSAYNLHDGVKSGARGSWSSAGSPPLRIPDRNAIVDLTDRIDDDGLLQWDVPPGKWVVLRFVCITTGERLKVPSPYSDGLATDHLSRGVTRRYLRYVMDRLRPEIGDFEESALKELYLASYEVTGQIWTPDLSRQFLRRRGYDLKRFLPVLIGASLEDEETTERFRYDFRKTLGELLVDAYYRSARGIAHDAGLAIESEAGGPGPPIHQVPVDALKALGSVDAVRGEFWPKRPDAGSMWVIKETAAAAHIYGKRRVHQEAFTSTHHWQDAPQSLKASADRAFAEGANQFVWHTASHQPPEAGKPGWVYGAGTHLGPNLVWWPMAKPFLDYLARTSFLLQQGLFVGDVVYYYGDQGFNFVGPKHVDPSLGFGYDYDVTNAEVIQRRMRFREGKLRLPDGMSYEVLVLPDREDIDLAVLKRIEQMVSRGATVVGPKPVRSTGLSGYPRSDDEVRSLADSIWGPCDGVAVLENAYQKGKVVCGKSIREVLQERGVGPDFQFESARPNTDLDFIHRRTPEADIYFVRNKLDRPEQVEAVFRVKGRRPEIWRSDTGETLLPAVYDAVETGVKMPLAFEAHGSYFVIFRAPQEPDRIVAVERDGAPSSAVVRRGSDGTVRVLAAVGGEYSLRAASGETRNVSLPSPAKPVALDGPWEVRFQEGLGAPASVTIPSLISWTDHADPGVRCYSGIATYRKQFPVAAESLGEGRRVYLDLGSLWAVGEVAVNGKDLGTVWKAPFRLDVTAALRPGGNELVVRVANTWSNRLAGEARGECGPAFTRTNVTGSAGTPWAEVPPIESGLLGPVTLEIRSEATLPPI